MVLKCMYNEEKKPKFLSEQKTQEDQIFLFLLSIYLHVPLVIINFLGLKAHTFLINCSNGLKS